MTDDSYATKEKRYFSGERRDIIDQLSVDANRTILEIGCGDGSTGSYAKRMGKCGRYVGIELFPDAAELASRALDEVHVANVESFNPPYAESTFDVLIASEVLEHLVDPWAVLRKLRPYLKPMGKVFASSPNIAHKSTLRMLLAGRWDLEDRGRMDRTHLRWFTPATYAAMFELTGYDVLSVRPVVPSTVRAKIFNALTANRFSHLFISQIVIEAQSKS